MIGGAGNHSFFHGNGRAKLKQTQEENVHYNQCLAKVFGAQRLGG